MKIGETKPLTGIATTRDDKRAATSYQQAQNLRAPQPVDSVYIVGIPEDQLTPKIRAALTELMDEVKNLREELSKSQKRINYLERLADQDTLVPLLNRRAFVRELTRAVSYAERYNAPISIVYLDLNGFKEINDTLGHAAGDQALKAIAHVLVENVRESDSVGRLGGDEFAVILLRTDVEEAQRKGRELGEIIAQTMVEYEGQSFVLSAAIGATTFKPGKSVSEMMADADELMYRDKVQMKASTSPAGGS